MMKYSYTQSKEGLSFAHMKDINASFKDLGAVCDAIRYKSVPVAMDILADVIENEKPILFRKHNKHMGSRHEIGGRKGRTPIKCAEIVRKVLVNAMANANNKGEDPDSMVVVHVAANKTFIAQRGPPKGVLFTQKGIYGYATARSSNLEFAKVELAIGPVNEKSIGRRMLVRINAAKKRDEQRRKVLEGKKKQAQEKKPKKKAITTEVQKEKEQKKDAKAPVMTEKELKAEPIKKEAPSPAKEVEKPKEEKSRL